MQHLLCSYVYTIIFSPNGGLQYCTVLPVIIALEYAQIGILLCIELHTINHRNAFDHKRGSLTKVRLSKIS
jgi:hypothetical protein